MQIQNRQTDRGTGTDRAEIERQTEELVATEDGQIEGLTALELRERQTGKLVATEQTDR